MKAFTITLNTIPGQSVYKEGTKDVRTFFYVAIVTEGCQEEIQYINGINKAIVNIDEMPFRLICVNDLIDNEIIRKTYSNPLQRLRVLIEWRNECERKYGANPQDEDWLICDRDNSSFSDSQYDELLKEAGREKFKVIVSNPAFQIWLLFHFVSDITALNLDTKDKSSERLAVVETELLKYVPKYVHGCLDMICYGANMNDAVKNSKNNPTHLTDLKVLTGSNFYELIERLNQIATIDTSVFSTEEEKK